MRKAPSEYVSLRRLRSLTCLHALKTLLIKIFYLCWRMRKTLFLFMPQTAMMQNAKHFVNPISLGSGLKWSSNNSTRIVEMTLVNLRRRRSMEDKNDARFFFDRGCSRQRTCGHQIWHTRLNGVIGQSIKGRWRNLEVSENDEKRISLRW